MLQLSTLEVEAKKAKLRLSVSYTNDLNKGQYVTILAKIKGEEGVEAVNGVEITYYTYNEDTAINLGQVITNEMGMVSIPIDLQALMLDTSGWVHLRFKAKGTDVYKRASKELDLRSGSLIADVEKDDEGMCVLSAKLIDAQRKEAVSDAQIFVGVERLFRPLPLGEGNYFTDEDGMVLVEFDDSIPTVSGKLTYIIKVVDNETYGNIEQRIVMDHGYIPEQHSTFNDRTMWSPPNKTPYTLLIIPNIMILAVYTVIVLLLINLYKINKSTKKNTT